MKLIKLTKLLDNMPVYVNIDKVCYISDEKDITRIFCEGEENGYVVKETADKVISMIHKAEYANVAAALQDLFTEKKSQNG